MSVYVCILCFILAYGINMLFTKAPSASYGHRLCLSLAEEQFSPTSGRRVAIC